MNDLKFAFRQLLNNPGFTAVAVLTLALGIGANTAIFSVANAVLWRTLPFPEPDRLVAIGEGDLVERSRSGASAGNYRDWKAQCRSFSGMSALETVALNLSGSGVLERVTGGRVTEDFFAVLGAQPVAGRSFTRANYERGETSLCLISHRLWKRRFGSRTDVVGQSIKLNGEPHTIAGVLPESVEAVQERVDVWTPLILSPVAMANREHRHYAVYARIQPGTSLEQARAEMTAIAKRTAADLPSVYSQWEIWVSTLDERSEVSATVFMFLLGTAGTILLIACANLAGLLLVRSVHRRVEICVRSALGADRLRLIRQLLIESAVLALSGGILGLLAAQCSFDLLMAFFPAELAATLPGLIDFHLDWRVLGFAVAISLIAGILFGLVPAIETSKVNLGSGLQTGGRDLTGGYQARRLSQVFVATQVAICFASVVFTAMCFNSLSRFVRIPPGFETTNLLTVAVTLAGPDFAQEAQRISFLEQAVERVQALPGVRAACSADTLPFSNPRWSRIAVAGRPAKGLRNLQAYTAEVSPDYFRTLGIPLSKGRLFKQEDHLRAVPTAIISDYLAVELFGRSQEPIGRRILVEPNLREIEIVGVVPNVRQMSLGTIQTQTRNLYLCQLQSCGTNALLALRTDQEARVLIGSLRKIVSELNPDLPLFAVKTMEELIALDQQLYRYLIWCMAGFSILALGLAVLGIYGTVAYGVAQRTREIGVRLALGSSGSRILTLVMFQGMKPVATGLILGIAGSCALVHPIVQSLFHDLTGAEPWMWFGISVVLVASMAAACTWPAFRACRVNPMEALRNE